ncbi:hypothetical protein OSTOST_25247, partial [Ostertagia ostertagi]
MKQKALSWVLMLECEKSKPRQPLLISHVCNRPSAIQVDEGLQPCTEDDYQEADPCGLLQSNPTHIPANAPAPLQWDGKSDEDQIEFSPALRIRYPQIKLPHFTGENDSWEEFWDTFSLIIDQNPQLSELEKILYLKDAIRGKAQNSIKSIPMRSSNYNLIVEVLKKKFGDKANNRSQIVQQLLDLPKAATAAQKCVETLEKINDLVFQMVATGYDIRKKHDPMWIDTILAKFPYDIIKDCMKASSTDSKLTRNFTGMFLPKHYLKTDMRHLTSRRINAETAQRAKTAKQESCLFCQRNNHQTKDCRTVRTPIDRRNALRGQPVCWKCFASDHRSRASASKELSQLQRVHISQCSYNAGETSPITISVT